MSGGLRIFFGRFGIVWLFPDFFSGAVHFNEAVAIEA